MKFLSLLVSCLFAHANPFAIDFPEKQELTHADYIEVQQQLRQIDILPLLQTMYPENNGLMPLEDFWGRCSKSSLVQLIDPETERYPIRQLVKIGHGGDRCVVCYATLNGNYPANIHSLIQGLKEYEFNGYVFYMVGGWPNPTGKEIQHIGVPYNFKISIMLEAQKLGFHNVLWIDSACYPLRSIDYLFSKIMKEGALLNWVRTPREIWRFILPQTRDLLQQLTGTNVIERSHYISMGVFGLRMNSPKAQQLIKSYYELVKLGTPFLSCFPEEFVITAIVGQKQFQDWFKGRPPRYLQAARPGKNDTPEEFEWMRQQGLFFYLRKPR